jgi:putative sterol carrier protein
MATYLSEEWLDRWSRVLAELPERPGLDARLQRTVLGTPDGDVTYHLVVASGRVVEAGPGSPPGGEPDVTFTSPYDVAVALVTGELDPSVAYMQGKLKAEGDPALLHTLLPLTRDTAWAQAVERIAAETDV